MRREVRLLDDEATYSVLSDRAVIPPFGVADGRAAASVRVAVADADGEVALAIPGKVTGRILRRGEVVVMESAGGGGYGDPLARPADAVAADVAAGYVTRERAGTDYGVIVGDTGVVDHAATAQRRREIGNAAITLPVATDETDPYAGIKGRHRTVRLAADFAARHDLTAGRLVELVGRNPAPMRGWVAIDTAVAPDTLALDAFARQALGVAAGDAVQIRPLATIVRPGEHASATSQDGETGT